MRRRVLAALAFFVVLSAVAACGSSSSPSAAGGAGDGTLRWALTPVSSWDPVTAALGSDVRSLLLVYEPLIRLDTEGQPTPGLASEWKYSDDGKTLDLTLRPGLKFSDDTAFDASAAKANLDRAKQQTGSVLLQQLAAVESVDAVDATHVRLNLSTVDYGLPLALGGKAGMMVSPKAMQDVKSLPTKPVGAGPFTLTSFIPGAEADLVRNPGYWDAAGVHLDGVSLLYTVDAQTILSGLRSGSIDLAYSSGDQIAAAKRAGLEVDEFTSLAVQTIMINNSMEPFDDPRITQAINYAIDREALIKTQNGGSGEVAYQIFPKGYVGYSPDVANLYPYDPGKAKQLLAEAGHPDGLAITITYLEAYSYKALAEQIQGQLAAVGIQGTLQVIPVAQQAERVLIKHEIGFHPNPFAGRESPVLALNTQYGKDGLFNTGHKESPELAQAISQAGSYPLDDPRYAPALQAATALAARQSPAVMLYTQPTVLVHTAKVTGLQPFIVAPRLDGVRLGQ